MVGRDRSDFSNGSNGSDSSDISNGIGSNGIDGSDFSRKPAKLQRSGLLGQTQRTERVSIALERVGRPAEALGGTFQQR